MQDRDPKSVDPRVLIGHDKPREIPCHVVRALLPATVGDDIDAATASVVERHTRECLGCRRELNRFDEAREALASIAEGNVAAPRLDDSFFASLHEGIVGELRRDSQIHSDTQQLQLHGVARRRRAGWAAWVPVAAALVATLVGGFLIGRSLDAPRAPMPNAVTSTTGVSNMLADPDFAPYIADALRRYLSAQGDATDPNADGATIVPVGDVADLEEPPLYSKSKDF